MTDFDCTTRDELKEATVHIFDGIDKETLTSVFCSWVINHEEEYDHKQKKIKNITSEFSEKTAKHKCIDLATIAVI
jgi:hypothetical protein